MKAFALQEWTAARVESVTPRIERHGKEMVVAVSLGLKINGPNLLIDLASETLRHGIYADTEGQEPLPEMTQTTPHLRAPELAGMPIHLPRVTLDGAVVYIDHGVEGEEEPIVLSEVKVDKLRVQPLASGWVDLFLRIGTNDVSDEELGILCGKLGHETRIRIEPPRVQAPQTSTTDAASDPNQPTLNGTTGAEVGDPSAERLAAEAAFEGGDATDAFVAQHADPEDDVDGEGNTPDVAPAKGRGKRAPAH